MSVEGQGQMQKKCLISLYTNFLWPGKKVSATPLILIKFYSFMFTQVPSYGAITKVCPTVEDGPKWKLAFRYPVGQFSSDFHEIL